MVGRFLFPQPGEPFHESGVFRRRPYSMRMRIAGAVFLRWWQ
jgi:hypothetical protein